MPRFDDIRDNARGYRYAKIPGFFTPFQGIGDFLGTLIRPVTGTLLLGALTTLCTVGAAASFVFGVGFLALGVALSPLLLCVPKVPAYTLGFGVHLCNTALALAVDAIVLAFGTLISLTLNPVALVTRSVASLVDPIINSCTSSADMRAEYRGAGI
jgi:hypothetical protein